MTAFQDPPEGYRGQPPAERIRQALAAPHGRSLLHVAACPGCFARLRTVLLDLVDVPALPEQQLLSEDETAGDVA